MMKRLYIGLVFALLLSASLSAQQRFSPPKVSTLPSACNVGDIVNLTTGTVGDYVCTAANTWGSLPLSGSITCANTGVVFADGANTPVCSTSLTYDVHSDAGASRTLLLLKAVAGGTPANAQIEISATDNADTTGDAALTLLGSHGASTNLNVQNGSTEGTGVTLNGEGYLDIFTKDATSAARFWDDEGNTLRMSIVPAGIQLGDGIAVQSDTTTAHTAKLQAYDNDTGPGYVTFATFTNGNSPSLVIAPPAGGATVSVTGRHIAAGATPSVANVGANSCGTDAATIAGNDNTGIVTVGATSGTQCRITFTVAAATRWQCMVNDESTAVLTRTTYVDTTHVDLKGVFTAGDVLSYICMPR